MLNLSSLSRLLSRLNGGRAPPLELPELKGGLPPDEELLNGGLDPDGLEPEGLEPEGLELDGLKGGLPVGLLPEPELLLSFIVSSVVD